MRLPDVSQHAGLISRGGDPDLRRAEPSTEAPTAKHERGRQTFKKQTRLVRK
jgi:hypothetical protein